MHGWYVCPTLSMVTTSHATGLEKTTPSCVKSRLRTLVLLSFWIEVSRLPLIYFLRIQKCGRPDIHVNCA